MNRRGFFAFLTGAAAAPYARPLPLAAPVPTVTWTPLVREASIVEIDAALTAAWDEFRLEPTHIYFDGPQWRQYEDRILQLALDGDPDADTHQFDGLLRRAPA